MKKLIPLILPVVGISIGIGAGLFLQKDSAPLKQDPVRNAAIQDTSSIDKKEEALKSDAALNYVKLSNQFIVPVIERNAVSAIIVISLSLEIHSDDTESIYAKEPKLRDGFLQVLFDHSNMGGFQGAFTNTATMATLRRSLLAVARKAAGEVITDVLITELARQDV